MDTRTPDTTDAPDSQVLTGRESGPRGEGVDPAGGTYGQADAGQGNWSDRGPMHDMPAGTAESVPERALGQGAEARGGSGGPGDRDVRKPPAEADAAPAVRAGAAEPMIASGLSNYSSGTQYGNQSRYGTPAQYNAERMVAGELQNGDHPEDRPVPGDSGPAHPNG